jgi:hypothetical protein
LGVGGAARGYPVKEVEFESSHPGCAVTTEIEILGNTMTAISQTNHHARSNYPWQNDYLHVSKKLAAKLVSCKIFNEEEIREFSDHLHRSVRHILSISVLYNRNHSSEFELFASAAYVKNNLQGLALLATGQIKL